MAVQHVTAAQLLTHFADIVGQDPAAMDAPTRARFSRLCQHAARMAAQDVRWWLVVGQGYTVAQYEASDQVADYELQQGAARVGFEAGGYADFNRDFFERMALVRWWEPGYRPGLTAGDAAAAPDPDSPVGGISSGTADLLDADADDPRGLFG